MKYIDVTIVYEFRGKRRIQTVNVSHFDSLQEAARYIEDNYANKPDTKVLSVMAEPVSFGKVAVREYNKPGRNWTGD